MTPAVQEQIERRVKRASEEGFRIRNTGGEPVLSTYDVDKPQGRRYRVRIRSVRDRVNDCACPDYRTNLLGTCKHIEAVLLNLKVRKRRKFEDAAEQGPEVAHVVLLHERELRVALVRPEKGIGGKVGTWLARWFDEDGAWTGGAAARLKDFLEELEALPGQSRRRVVVDEEVHQHLAMSREQRTRVQARGEYVRRMREGRHPAKLVGTELYPYQLDGMLHLAFGGRTLLADDMGLGKTIQAIAAAALLRRERGIERVLVVTPASLKHQWKHEIQRFTSLDATVIEGTATQRALLYNEPSFFTILNYELVLRDLAALEHQGFDLVILDEAQRIKNWKTKTAAAVKRLKSRYAFVLTGTPLENRLDELYSVMQFLDPRILGPLWRFNQLYYDLERKPRGNYLVLGHKNLDQLRETLRPYLLRRRKEDVLLELPERIDNYFRVPMSKLQRAEHDDYRGMAAQLAARAQHRPLTPKEHKRLMMALQKCRVIANALELHDDSASKKVLRASCGKLDELRRILEEQVLDGGRKVVIFSAFEGMANLIQERVLEPLKLGHAKLTGSVPSKRRAKLLESFRDDPECKVFLSTDAGSTGLNLQEASLVVNVDVPWNPAVLEQRIGRAHRHGQKRAVNVIHLVSEGSLEESMLILLERKRSIFKGVFDDDSVTEVKFDRSQGLLKVLNELLNGEPAGPPVEVVEAAGDAEAAPDAPAPGGEILVEALRREAGEALLLIEERPTPEGAGTLLVVLEEAPAELRAGLEDATRRVAAAHPATVLPPVHVLDRAGYQALRGLLGDAPGTAGREVFRAASLPTTAAPKPIERAREQLVRARDRLKLATLLAASGYPRDALPPLQEAIDAGVRGLGVAHGLPEELAERPTLLRAELEDAGRLGVDLSGKVASARELALEFMEAPEGSPPEKLFARIRDTAEALLDHGTGALANLDEAGDASA